MSPRRPTGARARTVAAPPEPDPVQPVEQPILCSPYEEPTEHWVYHGPGEPPTRAPGRRPASYYYTTRRTGTAQLDLLAEEQRDELTLVNLLRADVKRWREAGYPGAEQVTKQLLRHWAREDLPRRLFFCQREAAETIIYITEILASGRKLQWKTALSPEDFARLMKGERPSFVEPGADWYPRLIDPPLDGGPPLVRYGCKMATGSGKTVVMAMLIAWTLCNRGRRPSDVRFPSAVLVVCPNLTIKERLQVLRPEHPDNYYQAFDLVPSSLLTELRKGRVLVENWHRFLPESPHAEGGKTYAVVYKGEEGPEAFGRRVLGDLYDRGPIMVLNDEAHHAYRPAPVADEERMGREEREEREEATVWVGGLDRINASAGIACCVDLSATPFYIAGSGHPEGTPFPWLVSDFGLVDAIESGIVKIPRLPVAEDTGRPVPRYFALWRDITEDLEPGERLPGGKPRPEVVWRKAQDALLTLASQWVGRFEQLQASAGPGIDRTPPVLIIVCDNTDIAEYFFQKISGEQVVEVEDDEDDGDDDNGEATSSGRRGRKKKTRIQYGRGEIFPDYFSNTPEHPYRTIRIDSKLLAEAESRVEAGSRADAAEKLREIVATVGRPGQPGEQVRCVISVQMLSEGWDANNVTHILGLRAFGSQLLCEQVVGRGLRRMDYVVNKETGLLDPAEYVDIYGVPFSLIPFRGREPKSPPPKEDRPRFHVRALPERSQLSIRFPVVEGYAFALRKGVIKADVSSIEPLVLDPVETPQAVFVKPQVGVEVGIPSLAGGFQTELQDRRAYYESTHLQTIEFEIAREIVRRLLSATDGGQKRRISAHVLFPQVFWLVDEYVRTRVDLRGCDPREIGLSRYADAIAERIFAAIRPDESAGEPPLLPLLNRHRPIGDTSVVDFKTVKPCFATQKSHINLVAADTGSWEQAAAFALEASDVVVAYARNEGLEFSIPYEFLGIPHSYYPDFLVRLVDGSTLILEIKGRETDEDRAKYTATDRWVAAVNNWGKLGRWRRWVCKEPMRLGEELARLVEDEVVAAGGGGAARRVSE